MPISEADWLDDLEHEAGGDARLGAEKALLWFRAKECRVDFTGNKKHSLCINPMAARGVDLNAFLIRGRPPNIEVVHRNIRKHPSFENNDVRIGLFKRVESVPGYNSRSKPADGYQPLPLARLIQCST